MISPVPEAFPPVSGLRGWPAPVCRPGECPWSGWRSTHPAQCHTDWHWHTPQHTLGPRIQSTVSPELLRLWIWMKSLFLVNKGCPNFHVTKINVNNSYVSVSRTYWQNIFELMLHLFFMKGVLEHPVIITLFSLDEAKSALEIFPVPRACLRDMSRTSPAPTRLSSLESWEKLMGQSGWIVIIFLWSPAPAVSSVMVASSIWARASLHSVLNTPHSRLVLSDNTWPIRD